MKCNPIYSNHSTNDYPDQKLEKHVLILLSRETVDNINKRLSFAEHGIYIFIQYEEKAYIINGFSEDVFWSMVNGLYKLIHDCGNGMINNLLQEVPNDGFKSLSPFNVTERDMAQKLSGAKEFIIDIENMRTVNYHNMKPSSTIDQASIKKAEKRFQDILQNSKKPQTNAEWEGCISWVYRNCKILYKLINERLDFLETGATDKQQAYFCEKYYKCLNDYFQGNMYNIIKEALKKRRRDNINKLFIQSLVNKYKDKVSEKAVELVKCSDKRADPYFAAIQAADTIVLKEMRT